MLASKKIFRWLIYALILVLILMAIIAAVIRFYVFPNIDQYKDDIANKITHKIGLNTTIEKIVTDWDGISPRVSIRGLDIYDENDQSALHLENVRGTLSWFSLPMMKTHLSSISIRNPTLSIKRNMQGDIFVAGIAIGGEGKPELANWLLSQQKIKIKNASVIWQDDMRQAPELSLNKVNLKLKNPAWRQIFGQHLFTFSAQPSTGTTRPITLNGDFFGRDVSQLHRWRGNVNLQATALDLAIWKQWIDYPIDLQTGSGNTNAAISFAQNKINKIKASISLINLTGKLNQNEKPLNAKRISGLLTWEKNKQSTTVSAQNLKLLMQNEQGIHNGSGLVSFLEKNGQPWINASAILGSINLNVLETLNESLPLPEKLKQQLTNLKPQGQLNNASLNWQGPTNKPNKYRLKTRFTDLSLNANNGIPGFKKLSGEIDANEKNGTMTIASNDALLILQDILRWPIPADQLNGKVTWNKSEDIIKIMAKDVFIANKHIKGTVNANYDLGKPKGGYLDLSANFDNGNIKYAPFYYPSILDEEVTEWLDSSILSGKANNVQLTVKGHLDDFPYVDKKNRLDTNLGLFRVSARISDAVLAYGDSWPKINGLGLDLLFEGNRMELNADKGDLSGVNIVKAKAVIPELNTKVSNAQILNITGETQGAITDGIHFINASPVKTVTLGFTDTLKTAGNGRLNIDLSLPLNDIDNSTFKGAYKVSDGTMYADEDIGLPEIRHIFGTLNFNTEGISAQNIKAELFDGPTSVSIKTLADSTININATGTMHSDGIQRSLPHKVTEALEGSANWQADLAIKKPLLNLNFRSDLDGMAIKLPAPLEKAPNQKADLIIAKKQALATEDQLTVNYNQLAFANVLRTQKNDQLVISAADIAINTPVKTPESAGINLRGKLDYVNLDEWLALTKMSDNGSDALQFNQADLSIQKLDLFKRSLHDIKLQAKPKDSDLDITMTSQELTGNILWQGDKTKHSDGKVIARLEKLHIPSNDDEQDKTEESNEIRRQNKKYPALDVQVDDFKLGNKSLGKLSLNAFESNEDWVIEELKLNTEKTIILADGAWHNWTRNPNTNLNFSLSTQDIGDTLKQFGQADAVKDGVAIISGKLQWAGSPHEFKKDGLNGEFQLGASKGEILKVKPGVGRLLGLLTLQSLPRRLTLDFRDLFSEGFAFDEISATAKINNGVMRSDDFFMTGPAAETEIKGETNLKTETQNLQVKVVPHISDSLSLAALAGGPLAGAAAWLAQKILKDPLNKVAQSEYVITGTWDNPVEADAVNNDKKVNKPSPLNLQ